MRLGVIKSVNVGAEERERKKAREWEKSMSDRRGGLKRSVGGTGSPSFVYKKRLFKHYKINKMLDSSTLGSADNTKIKAIQTFFLHWIKSEINVIKCMSFETDIWQLFSYSKYSVSKYKKTYKKNNTNISHAIIKSSKSFKSSFTLT